MRPFFKAFSVISLFCLPALCSAQELTGAMSYMFSDNRYSQGFGGEASLFFPVSDGWEAGGMTGGTNYFFSETEIVGFDADGPITEESQEGRNALFLGGGVRHTLIEFGENLSLSIGFNALWHLFAEFTPLEIAPGVPGPARFNIRYSRAEFQLPFTLKYAAIGGSRTGVFISAVPAHMFGSARHRRDNSDIGRHMNLAGVRLGAVIDLAKPDI